MDQRIEPSATPSLAYDGGPTRRERRRHRRRIRGLVLVVGLLVVLVGSFAADVLAYRGRVHPGVELAGVDLGGRSVAQATGAIAEAAAELGASRLEYRHDALTFETTPTALGWRPDVEATVQRALEVGRGGPLWRDAATRALAWVRSTRIPWVATWDLDVARATIRPWAREVAVPPQEGRVVVREGEVVGRDPVPGRRIAVVQVVELAKATVQGRSGASFRLPVLPRAPRTTAEDVAAAVAEVRGLISEPVEVELGTLPITIEPEDLGGLVRTRVVDEGEEAGLEVRLAPRRVEELLAPYRSEVEVAPRSARLTVSGGRVVVATPSQNGRRIDVERASERLLEIARSPERTGRIRLAVARPELTTRQARGLGIRERIAGFTTNHAAGEPRVTNIHLAADVLDGAIVMPGEEFSLNGRVGGRTRERGFVEAPVIYEGRFTTDVGGGTSQLATTTFNAAFFAGFPFVEYQPHSYYISRYPMGREATVSYPKPDLRFVNDLPDPVLIVTSYTASSITVEIWGRRTDRRVTSTEPQVTSRGSGGFTVVVQRTVREGGEVARTDSFTTFYRYA